MKLLENTFVVVVGAFILTLLVFYGIDHLIMAAQGLPLNFDLTPAQ
jgi:preprotein translocase subunit SecE